MNLRDMVVCIIRELWGDRGDSRRCLSGIGVVWVIPRNQYYQLVDFTEIIVLELEIWFAENLFDSKISV